MSTEGIISSFVTDELLQILRFIQCSNGDNDLHINDSNCDKQWKLRHIFDFLSGAYSKYSPPEYLALDDVIILLKGMIIFKYCIPKKHM
jgi:hypothetical protein